MNNSNLTTKCCRFAAALTIAFICGVIGLMLYVLDLQSKMTNASALRSAEFYSNVIQEIRSLYTTEVVNRVAEHPDITITHNYWNQEYAIPVPTTLSMLFGERLKQHFAVTKKHLYSAYPLPLKQQQQGLSDSFRRQAWQALNLDPGKPYFEFTNQDGQPVLRYAIADVMSQECVNCHNSRSGTPKSDWKAGDVRGVLEVVYPISGMIGSEEVGGKGIFIWAGVVVAFGLICLGLMIYQFRMVTGELEQRVEERTDEVRETESSLRESKDFNNRLLEAVHSMIIGVNTSDVINYWNFMAENYFGLKREDVLGQKILDVGLKWDWQTICTKILDCRASESYSNRFETDFVDEYRGRCVLSISIAPIVGRLDKHKGYLIIADDVTEQKNQQAENAQKEKLQSIGQLAAGIAHEINTPIQYLGDNTRFLQETFQELNEIVVKWQALISGVDEKSSISQLQTEFDNLWAESDIEYIVDDVPKAIEESLHGIERVSTIVKAMKEFARPSSKVKDYTDINRAIENTITVSCGVWSYVADMETDLDPGMGQICCFAGQINDVVLNMIVNSSHAIEAANSGNENQKGVIKITTRRYSDYAEIRVKDTGTGIPKKIQKRIFDPFFTTKDVGKGIGQGLSISRNIIVDQHGGELFFETQEGSGTTFVIRLPLDQPMAG